MDVLFEFRFIIAFALGFVLFALFEWEKTKGLLTKLMLSAKSLAKDYVLKTGEAQETWVMIKAYQYLPKWITTFIPETVMRKLIKYLYHMAKDYVDDGEINNSL